MARTGEKDKKTVAKHSGKDAAEISEYARKTLESAIPPLELVEYPVFTTSASRQEGIFTVLRINSLDIGVLYPAQYRVVTNRNSQSIRLATWAFRRVIQILSRQDTPVWVSFYSPAKMLMRGNLYKLFESEQKKGTEALERIVIELSSEILYNDAEEVSVQISKMRNDFGVRFMLSEYGDEYCPVLRLSEYDVDCVLLDRTIDSTEKISGSIVKNAVKMAKDLNKKVLLGIPGDTALRRAANEAGIDLYMPDSDTAERGN